MDEHNFKKMISDNVFEVSDFLDLINQNLRLYSVKIKGEITQVKKSSAGHIYFSLKDKKDGSVMECAIWSSNYRLCSVEIKEGTEVIVSGYADIYKPSGRFSFKARTVQLVGEGELKKEYLRLKEKLEKEGIFEEERKRDIPKLVKKIGVITSKEGAVISDFLNNLNKYGFKVKFADSRVEGAEAIKDLHKAILSFKKTDIDVLVIIRGGGSLESLLAFNNETLVREISNFPVPTIAGIGHDKDVPLLSLAADKMVSTPTAAANLLNLCWEKTKTDIENRYKSILFNYQTLFFKKQSKIKDIEINLSGGFKKILNEYKRIELNIENSLFRIKSDIENKKQALKSTKENIFNSYLLQILKKKEYAELIQKLIFSFDPNNNLKLGYCIARKDGKLIKEAEDFKADDIFDLQIKNGIITSKVNKITKNDQRKPG